MKYNNTLLVAKLSVIELSIKVHGIRWKKSENITLAYIIHQYCDF